MEENMKRNNVRIIYFVKDRFGELFHDVPQVFDIRRIALYKKIISMRYYLALYLDGENHTSQKSHTKSNM